MFIAILCLQPAGSSSLWKTCRVKADRIIANGNVFFTLRHIKLSRHISGLSKLSGVDVRVQVLLSLLWASINLFTNVFSHSSDNNNTLRTIF
jgi:hypothetical protein